MYDQAKTLLYTHYSCVVLEHRSVNSTDVNMFVICVIASVSYVGPPAVQKHPDPRSLCSELHVFQRWVHAVFLLFRHQL